MDQLALKISGPAGSGIMLLGEILASSFEAAGFYTLVYPEYPSRIRGGDNNVQIVISSKPNLTPRQKVDFVFSMDKDLNESHRKDTAPGGMFFEAVGASVEEVAKLTENSMSKNTVMAGIIWKMCRQPLAILLSQIKSVLGNKHLEDNLKAAKAGFEQNFISKDLRLKPSKDKITGATGNEIFTKAIEAAGCEYVSIYPMTPITSLLANLAKTQIKMVTPEDEIFAALSAVGASYAGKRALTATSGGGFCLMGEAVGFASMAEIPLVVILGQRSGPSSGIPTYSGQGDLNQAIFSTNGEAQKIVLAPGDLEEIFTFTQESFNLADIYQLPVIILTDKYLCESRFSLLEGTLEGIKVKIDRGKRFKGQKNYQRYQLTQDGISPRAYPGEAAFLTNSYEHDESGYATDEAKTRVEMVAKRERKLTDFTGGFTVLGNKKSTNVIVGWGSTKTVLVDFVAKKPDLKYIHIWRPWPFSNDLKAELARAKKIVVVENNSTGQMAKLITRETGLETQTVTKDDGRPFFAEELNKLLNSKL